MLFQVTHTTRYLYQAPVTHCLNELRLTPRRLPGQDVRQVDIRVHPAPAFMHRRMDYYGNEVTSFEVFERHADLQISAESLVAVEPSSFEPAPSISWEDARGRIQAQADDACIEASEFIHSSPYVHGDPQLNEYARPTFVRGRPLLEAVQDLTHRIHTDFKYRPQSTSIDVPLAAVLRNRRGVCQDFAHVMIGALRSQRLAARYVSGYVRPGPNVQGAQASHAWVSVFIPGTGPGSAPGNTWLSFDPTNDLIVSDSHVTLAWGRDYGDVTPVKGISLGGGGQSVKVEVYLKPVA
jgi:transglutaminase-like putative cysteine protease